MKFLALFMALSFGLQTYAQGLLDLSKDRIELRSKFNHVAHEEGENKDPHLITILPTEKRIVVIEEKSEEVVFNIVYSVAFDGNSESVELQPGETIFMVREGEVELVSFQEVYRTLSINYKDGKTMSFGQIDAL